MKGVHEESKRLAKKYKGEEGGAEQRGDV